MQSNSRADENAAGSPPDCSGVNVIVRRSPVSPVRSSLAYASLRVQHVAKTAPSLERSALITWAISAGDSTSAVSATKSASSGTVSTSMPTGASSEKTAAIH
jgi:hypothetical protein